MNTSEVCMVHPNGTYRIVTDWANAMDPALAPRQAMARCEHVVRRRLGAGFRLVWPDDWEARQSWRLLPDDATADDAAGLS
jgi:hypothetical protein